MKSLFAAKAPLYVHLKPPISISTVFSHCTFGTRIIGSNSHEILVKVRLLDVMMNRLSGIALSLEWIEKSHIFGHTQQY